MKILKKYLNLPTLLTLTRLVISPLTLPVLLVYLLPYNNLLINICLGLLFLAFSFTDFLDGYYARKYQQTSKLGGALDHIADKFLVYSTFIALLTVGKIYFFWVIIFIGRDFFVMGLRTIALENNFNIPVGYLGKVKTTSQMMLITWLIVRPMQFTGSHAATWQQVEYSLLSITLVLTLISAYHYYHGFIEQLARRSMITQDTES